MKQFMKVAFASMMGTFLALAGLFFVFMMIIAVSAGSKSGDWEKDLGVVKDNSVLKIVFDGPLKDHVKKRDLFASLWNYDEPPVSGLYEITQVLKEAAQDKQIKGLFLHFKSFSSGPANAEGLRRAILNFKNSGKFVIAYGEYYSELSYAVASAADEVLLYPKGFFEWNGLFTKRLYFKNTLNKLDVIPQIFRVGKYKSAIEPLTSDKMSEASREQTELFLDTIWEQIVNYASEKTKTEVSQLDDWADEMSVVFAKDALEKGFVSQLASMEEVEERLKELTGAEKEPHYASWRLYYKTNIQEKKSDSKNKVALVFAAGNIVTGDQGDDAISSDVLSQLLNEIRRDEEVKAVVIRVNSPGGSALASDVIWTSTQWLKEAKPVVTSFGNVAASGGYYMSAGSQFIFAEPTTITGSIGVFGVRLSTKKLFRKHLGVTLDEVKTNTFADLDSLQRLYKPEEVLKVQTIIDGIYEDFLKVVTDGRPNLENREQTHEIAQGRVWTGLDAKAKGLVDEMGGIEEAIAKAAEMAQLSDFSVKIYPKEPSAIEAFVKQLSGVSSAIVKSIVPAELRNILSTKKTTLYDNIYTRMPFDIEVQ